MPENNQLENIELRLQRLESLVLEDVMEMLRRMENKIDVVATELAAMKDVMQERERKSLLREALVDHQLQSLRVEIKDLDERVRKLEQ
ncbi:MAG TPA: hypothetical protein VNQ79_00365 [Blastocatellia bacterium]|nr:hypothetical protein [Blastocatellia bacterium]